MAAPFLHTASGSYDRAAADGIESSPAFRREVDAIVALNA